MKKLYFVKMQGTGNDFILINNDDLELAEIKLTKNLVKKMCCRNFGIGADGIILISKGNKIPFKFSFYNSDGTQAEIGGNAIRCYIKYLFSKGLITNNNLKVDTKIGILNFSIDGNVITVEMGKPSKIKNLAYKSKKIGDRFPMKIDNDEFIFTPISIGNPHAVIFCKDSNLLCELLEALNIQKYGKLIENHTDIFPDKTNVEFVKILSNTELLMRVWERGIGETLACGTCACAAVVAGILTGKIKKDEFIKVKLPGGILEVKWSGNLNETVILRGEANEVFEGYYNIY